MTKEQVREILTKAFNNLRERRVYKTAEILDQLEKLVPLFRGMNASTVQAAALACGIKTEVNSGEIIALIQKLIAYERLLTVDASDIREALFKKALESEAILEELASSNSLANSLP